MEEVLEGKDFSFAGQEERILKLWERIDAFRNQLRLTEGKPEYIFYDGPPFATGLPHYGHLLAGTIKDIVTRFQTAIGHHVTRRFGWDCHGLPVEYEIDQKLGTRTKDDVLKFGIANYNEECRKIVMRYSKEWETIVTRMGRWIDFENDYKTLDPEFMESVWWVFKQLYEKGLVYKGFKVMPYSTGCNTPLSNFEAGQNYKDVSDPALVVSFPLMDEPGNPAMVAWTTTPWTLPSNLALCVNASFTYLKVKCVTTGSIYIIAESRLSELPSKKSKEAAASSYEVIGTFKGQELVGKRYKPLFEYFMELSSVAFKVVADSYVTDDSGTGIVHCAPAFGEDDYRVCLQAGIIQKGENLPNPVDMNGCFTEVVTHFKGRYVKEADKDIIATVKGMGRLVSVGNIVHSYPFCWRSDTPLIYKAVPSWFVAVEKIKDRLLECNKQTYWVPEFVKEKRFHNWLENSRDWAISRSRYWGTPLPIWVSDDGLEIIVIGSIEELERLSGVKVTDLHRHYIDDLVIPSRRGPEYGVLKRVEEVFDCWFESGSMPYGYIHYPFENQELFDRNFPGHFVAEGLDQTRGWFYTLMVLSTALFDKPAFRNLICNGLVLAEDGKKMSKRLKNYPSPMVVVDEYGADALRLYLINSPVVRAEPLRFKKEGVHAVVKDVFLPWYNAYRFLVQNALRLNLEGLEPFLPLDATTMESSTNVLDHWINSASHSLVKFVKKEMEAYRLYTVVPFLLKFIDNLTNIYVRFNRKRLKGRTGEADCRVALSTLFTVLLTVCKTMAPLTPFFTEVLYQNLRRVLGPIAEESVHYCSFPKVGGKTDQRIEKSVARMMTVIDLARIIRERHNKPLKTPLREMIIVHPDEGFLQDITGKLGEYVQEEINVRSIVPCNDPLKFASLRAEPDFSLLGKRLGRAMGSVAKEVKAMDQASILAFEKNGTGHFAGHQLVSGEIKVIRDFKPPDGVCKEDTDASGDGDVLVILDLRPDQSLVEAGIAREVVNRIQKLRKKAGLEPTDAVEVYIQVLDGGEKASSALKQAVVSQASYIQEAVGSLLPQRVLPLNAVELASQKFEGVGGGDFKVTICRATLSFDEPALLEACSGEPQHALFVKTVLLARDLAKLRSELASNKQKAELAIAGVGKFTIIQGKHFYLSVGDHYATGLLSL